MWDRVSAYRLPEGVVNGYLEGVFPGQTNFLIQVG